MNNFAIIIPALNPTTSLIHYIKQLFVEGAKQVIVVNDGSKEECTDIFTELSKIEGCTVLTHQKNRGKGRALKTAFAYFLKHNHDMAGVITADADGQHSIEDVGKIARALVDHHQGIILGSRDFGEAGVPLKSFLGNRVTSTIFQCLYGTKLKDTQTGLRGIPKDELPWIIELKGERYEYEINMLIYARKMNVKILEVPIQTLYFNNNSGSHYNPLADSLKVFMKLISGFLYYSYSTIVSGFVDLLCFIVLTSAFLEELPLKIRIFYATFVARILSSSSNFLINRKFVFKGENSFVQSLFKYVILVLGITSASYFLVVSSNLYLGLNVILAKICIDSLLGILSYEVQLHWVFKESRHKKVENALLEKNDEA